MLYGDRSRFAIEFELDENYGAEWLFGKLCYWIDGRMIGSYDLGTSLRDALFQMQPLIGDNGNRKGGAFCSLQKEKVFTSIDRHLYGDSPKGVELESMPEMWARFDVKIPIDVFDECKVYLVDCSDISKIIYRIDGEGEVIEVALHVGEFDAVISEAFKVLNDMYERGVGKLC